MSVSELRHDMAVVSPVQFENGSPLTAAVRLADELSPEPYPAAGRGSRRSPGLTAT